MDTEAGAVQPQAKDAWGLPDMEGHEGPQQAANIWVLAL